MPSPEDVKHVAQYAARLPEVDVDVVVDALTIMPLDAQLESIRENYLEKQDLNASRFAVLRRLFHHAGRSMSPAELADEISLTRAAMTTTLDGLESMGYVVRTPHPTDRRMVCVSLTSKGKDYLGRTLPEHYRLMTKALGILTPSERAAMISSYRKLITHMRAMKELANENS